MPSFPSSIAEFVEPQSRLAYDIHELVRQGIDLDAAAAEPKDEPLWKGLRDKETELWLDSGDIGAIQRLWNQHFCGLTTNNTLLNDEIQKGEYDELIPRSGELLNELEPEQRVREIGFILNARHGLRLVENFRCRVCVELHTDFAHDLEASMAYARRFHEICPDFFVVKVPFTPTGVVATRRLRNEGLPINMTLGFSARQNYLATTLANPSYVNVFLGRLNAYVADNDLGDGSLVGEKATLASQREVKAFSLGLPQNETKQIAASVRNAEQLPRLAGVDVITMPPQVAADACEKLDGRWPSQVDEDYSVSLAPDVDASVIRLDTLWSVTEPTRNFVGQMILNQHPTEQELIEAAADHGIDDLFPQLSEEELETISEEGKIPRHRTWGDKIMKGELAIDSLLTLAGLAHFAASQAELDQRIRETMA